MRTSAKTVTVVTWVKCLLPLCLYGLSGCHFVTFPDPNSGKMARAEMIQRNIQDLYKTFGTRVRHGEITEAQKQKMIDQLAADLAKGVDVTKVKDKEAWRYADILRQGGRWQDSETLYVRAVAHAKGNPDRFVNDALQLARVEAHLKNVEEGIKTARSTFGQPGGAKAPIMYSILYEFVPEALGQGKDLAVAELLKDSIGQHMQVEVDPKSTAGALFLSSRPIHIRKAWDKLIMIYQSAGRQDLAKDAIDNAEKILAKFGSI